MDELMERRRVVRLGGTDVATLDVIDGLMYLCLHGSLSGGHQLVWLKDLDQMVAGEPTDWDELVRRARLSGTELVVGMQLERARSVLGAPVPPEVVETLAGAEPWWKWWQRRERQVGPARWGGYAGTGRTYVAATSGGSLSSAGQLLRSMGADVVRPTLAHRLRLNGADPLDESPRLYQPLGGAADRADYLQLVAAGHWDRTDPVSADRRLTSDPRSASIRPDRCHVLSLTHHRRGAEAKRSGSATKRSRHRSEQKWTEPPSWTDRGRSVGHFDLHPAHRIPGVATAPAQAVTVPVGPVERGEQDQEDDVEIGGVVPGEVGRGHLGGPGRRNEPGG